MAVPPARHAFSSWVTAVVHREPGMLAKLVSTLDVFSEGKHYELGRTLNSPPATCPTGC